MKTKRVLLNVLIIALMSCVFMFGMLTVNVKAESTFVMTEGASIRLAENKGIRFSATIDEYDEEKEYGFVIVPKAYLVDNEITDNYVESLNALAETGTIKSPIILNSKVTLIKGKNTINGSITGILYENINLEFVGIGFEKSGESYRYASFSSLDDIARTAPEVAVACLDEYYNDADLDSETKLLYQENLSVLENYVDESINKSAGLSETESDLTKPTWSFGIAQDSALITVGETVTLNVSSNIPYATVSYSTDSENVSVTEAGVVTATAPGEYTVTAKCLNLTDTISIKVVTAIDETARSYETSTGALDLTGLPFTMQNIKNVKIGEASVVNVAGGEPLNVSLQNVSTANVGEIRTEERLKITVNGTDMYVTRSMSEKEFSALPVELTLADGSVYLLENVNAYTKIIKTPSDLQNTFGSGKVMDGTYDDGYYVLANNINASTVNFKSAVKALSANKIFRGILDGKGYTIFNADVSSTSPTLWGHYMGTQDGGLIGMTMDSSAAIRNLGLINVKAKGMSVISDRVCRNAGPGGGYPVPVIENMYVEVSSSNENLLGLSIEMNAYVQNVIVKYDKHEQINGNGTFFRPAAAFTQEGGVGGANNCYSISLTKASGTLSGGAIVEWPYAGLTSYDNAELMKQAGNDYSMFNDCWTVAQGEIPVWKNNVDETSDNTARSFDISTKTLDLTGMPFSAQDITSVKVGPASAVAVTNGIMPDMSLENATQNNAGTFDCRTEERLKITVNGTDMYVTRSMSDEEFSGVAFAITLTDGREFYLNNVKVYTKVIKTPADLASVFGGETALSVNRGYYILGANIDASTIDFVGSAKASSTFYGIFDGKGYSIFNADVSQTTATVPAQAWGSNDGGLIANSINEDAAIRNLGLINIKANGTYALSKEMYLLSPNSGRGYQTPLLENLYVKVSDDTTNFLGLGILCNAYIKNVIVEYNSPAEEKQPSGQGGAFVSWNSLTQEGGNVGGVSDCYLISKTKACYDNSNNEKNIGVKCYDNVEAMKQAGNDYSTFNNCWTVAQGEIPVWKNLTLN